MIIDGQPWEHIPHVGWRPATRPPLGTIYQDPRTLRRRSRRARWLDRHRHHLVVATVLAVVAGYMTTIVWVFDHTLPTLRTAGIFVAVALVLVGVLLAVVIWSRRE